MRAGMTAILLSILIRDCTREALLALKRKRSMNRWVCARALSWASRAYAHAIKRKEKKGKCVRESAVRTLSWFLSLSIRVFSKVS